MPKTSASKKLKEYSGEPAEKGTSFFDYLRFGESYTSLVLGIIVVIIATALLLSFVHNKNAGNVNTQVSQSTQNTVQITQKAGELAKQAPSGDIDGTATTAPTATPVPTKEAAKPTVKPTVKPVSKPTAKPTQVALKPTAVEKKIAVAKPNPTKAPQVKTDKDNNVWVVQKGETLWQIAESKYTSGYNWVDIARANNLVNPDDIHAGDRLVLPKVTAKVPTIQTEKTQVAKNVQENTTPAVGTSMNKITGKIYTVEKGDNLWSIAVRAYGDGYKWVDIARANNLANPGMIFSGNKLDIPRNS